MQSIQTLLYPDAQPSFADMLRDLDMTTTHHAVIDNIIKTPDNMYSVIRKPNFCHIIAILDKLMMRNILTVALNSRIVPQRTVRKIRIINHSLSTNDLLKLYVRTDMYDLPYCCVELQIKGGFLRDAIHDNEIADCADNELVRLQLLDHVIRNGLRVDGIKICGVNMYDVDIKDADIECCRSLKKLEIRNNNQISTCGQFAKSLRELKFSASCYSMRDDSLQNCTAIEVLDVSDNKYITTCAPFAATLRKLVARYRDCGMRDAGLHLCTHITDLDVLCNSHITTCEPFATSLKICNANDSGICDDGLAQCTSIEKLDASCNAKITTCAPFASTLKILYASTNRVYRRYCGICNKGLELCHGITRLHASDNPKITTCAPFARTLTILDAAGADCGITNSGLQLCRFLTDVRFSYNIKIDEKYLTSRNKYVVLHNDISLRDFEKLNARTR